MAKIWRLHGKRKSIIREFMTKQLLKAILKIKF
jgi:hypothetical protein